MYPIYDIKGIEEIEKEIEEQHVVIFLIVKPHDKNADEFIDKLNYWHQLSERYCSIYMLGYSESFLGAYSDAKEVSGIGNRQWEYSDTCFIEVRKNLEKRLKNWRYSGTPELIVLQNKPSSRNPLDFSSYNYIDIDYGLEHQYIDSVSRFMERLIRACESEVTSKAAIKSANRKRIKPRTFLENAIENCDKLPIPAKKIIKDNLFFKTSKTNNKELVGIF